jgi:Hemerythrin HHE cation binding domain
VGAWPANLATAYVKRDAALASLSRGHHEALVAAQKLRRADSATAGGARKALLSFWEPHGRAHFRLEEEILLPAFAARGDPYHPLVARALCDHVAIRRGVAAVAHGRTWELRDLHQLGLLLAAHVRLEERELFPLIESALSTPQLAALAKALERAERSIEG